MPLIPTETSPEVCREPLRGFMFEMKEPGGSTIRVLVTAIALQELDRYRKPLDPYSGRDIFDEHRDQIEAAASKKFDERGADQAPDGRPLLLVQSMDLAASP